MTDLELKGKVSAIDMQKRAIHLKDEKGTNYVLEWTEVLDVVMRKWKPGHYLDLIYNADTYIIKSAKYWQEGRDIWPKEKGNFKPRNERLIVTQMLIKTYADLVRFDFDPSDFNFKIARKIILDAVEEDIDRVMKIGSEKNV